MISTVKLYKDSLILEEKNFIVDDIEDYLATLTDTLSYTKFQYIKHGLNISIKIDKNQTFLNFKNTNDYNYAAIQNMQNNGTGTEKIVYYFVTKMEWGAEDTVRLYLTMDVLNTFKKGTDFTLSPKTTILREHNDRYKVVSGGTFTNDFTGFTYCLEYDSGNFIADYTLKTGGTSITSVNSIESNADSLNYSITGGTIFINIIHNNPFEKINFTFNVTYIKPKTYQRIIDPVSEGLDAVLYKEKEEEITDKLDKIWYLIYQNDTAIDPSEYNPLNAISCYLVPEDSVSVKKYDKINFAANDYNLNDYLFFTHTLNGNAVCRAYCNSGGSTFYQTNLLTIKNPTSETIISILVIKNNNNKFNVYNVKTLYDGDYYYNTFGFLGEADDIDIEIYASNFKYYQDVFTALSDIAYPTTHNMSITTPISLTGTFIAGIDNWDRTDSKLIKIIMTPYLPANFGYDDDFLIIGDGWSLDGNKIKLMNLNQNLINNMESSIENPLAPLYGINMNPATTDPRNDDNESKLYHSDYYVKKIVYDSFNFPIPLENIDETLAIFKSTNPDGFNIDFQCSNSILSRFLVQFPQIKWKRSIQDYDDVLYIGRNNELSIYNSAYINYLRNGYNYDVKNKERNEEQALVNTVVGLITTAAGIAGGAATGNPLLVGAGISAAASTFTSLSNIAYQNARAESDIQNKLKSSKDSAISVNNVDDVNLLLSYSRLMKSCLYKISDRMKKAIGDLFYYCGYSRNIQGDPSYVTRYWFNYIQANLMFATTVNIPDECLADIIDKFNQGVTILHHHTTWNFDQDKENWEVSIL